jgi:hypothetical chaperone protein
MYAGLDFGTSNCSIGVMKNQQPELVPLENGKNRMPSALFVPNEITSPANFSSVDIAARVRLIKQLNSKSRQPDNLLGENVLSDDAIVSVARHQLKAEHQQTSAINKTATSMLEALGYDSNIILPP